MYKEFQDLIDETKSEANKRNIKVQAIQITNCPNICSYAGDGFGVAYNGLVAPCWMLDIPGGYNFYNKNKEFKLPVVSFGNINDSSINELWNSREWKTYRNNFKNGNLPPYCKSCPVGWGQICG